MKALLIIFALGILPQSTDAVRESCDAIEVNAFYDPEGRLVFRQAIFLDWSNLHRRFDVRAWRLIKTEGQVPVRDWEQGGYVTTWHDGEQIRQVRTKSVQESWTMHDPELMAREVLPKESRRELRQAYDGSRDPLVKPWKVMP